MQRAESVGQGGEAWIGYKQDLRPCQHGLMLSIEPSFSVFYEGKPVVDYCQAVLSRGRNEWQWTADKLTDREMREVSSNLKGLTVRAPPRHPRMPGAFLDRVARALSSRWPESVRERPAPPFYMPPQRTGARAGGGQLPEERQDD